MTKTVELDCTGLKCPMPIVKIALAIKALQDGETLSVTASDSAFLPDLRAWVQMTGHELLSVEDATVENATVEDAAIKRALIRK